MAIEKQSSVFGDEDLKQLKDCLSGKEGHVHPTGDCFGLETDRPDWISPLLARLEAAELLAETPEHWIKYDEIKKAWLASKGEAV